MAAETSLRRRRRERSPRGRGGLVVFLLASLVPLGAAAWFLALPPQRREAVLDEIPDGVGGRALVAGISFGVMALLAWVALPAFHHASGRLGGVLAGLGERRGVARVLLFPAHLAVWLAWFSCQVLFAVDAFLILASACVALLLAVRIVVPDFLPAILSRFAG
ncbi:MAG: hypothetical protein ACC662_05715 [Planctomycetota bacterium]